MIRFRIFLFFPPLLFFSIFPPFPHLSSVATAEDSRSLARIMTSTGEFFSLSLLLPLSKVCIPHTLVTLISTKFTGGTS